MKELIRECFQTKEDVKSAAVTFFGIVVFLVCVYIDVLAVYVIVR